MKTTIRLKSLTIIAMFFVQVPCFAQWQGTNPVYFNGGNVGVGTSSPNNPIEIYGSVNGELNLLIQNGYTNGARTFVSSFPGKSSIQTDKDFTISTNGNGWSDKVVVSNLGNVGIGTATPAAYLDIGYYLNGGKLGAILGRLSEGTGIGSGTFLGVRGYATQPLNANSFSIEHSFYGQVNSSISFHRGGGMTGGFLAFQTDNNSERMRIAPDGNVGIGSTNPTSKLTVKGTVHAEEVKVDLSVPGPDYVFEESYPLQSLEELESYIKQNKHLPEVPSASQMETEGIKVGEMNMLLLKKVEEITLHLIELSRENEELKRRMKILEQN